MSPAPSPGSRPVPCIPLRRARRTHWVRIRPPCAGSGRPISSRRTRPRHQRRKAARPSSAPPKARPWSRSKASWFYRNAAARHERGRSRIASRGGAAALGRVTAPAACSGPSDVEVELELPAVVAVPAGMPSDLRFQCSLFRAVLPLLIVVCRNRDGTGSPGRSVPSGRQLSFNDWELSARS